MSLAPFTPTVNGHTTPAILPQGPPTLPEAPCSMTARILVKAVSCEPILITGRGQTGPEAAHNLLESVTALQTQANAPPPLASRTQRLSLLLACGLEKAVAKGDWKLVERLTKAAALVLAARVVQHGAGAYQVRSQTEPESTVYEIHGQACTCQDSRKPAEDTPPHRCKHVLSVLFYMRLLDQEVHTKAI